MASSEQYLVALLRSDHIKDHLLPYLATEDLTSLRGSSSAFCNLLTKRLFTRIHVTFTSTTFTRPSRVAALSRIGHHIEHLTFYFPHSDATFLPPLVHPLTGQEISFRYTPHTSMGSALTRPKYANSELQQILTDQYPPLFHAATNVPSFIHAMKMLPNMRHLTVRCPGQDPSERYRRDIVDYALISMRIAVERAPLTNLNKLSLSSLHPGAFNYLRHVNGIGAVPSAGRRWKQIKKLHISVEAWDFYGSSPGLDHLKVIDDYIRTFSPALEKFAFTWVGRKGPCPVALCADPLFAPPRSRKLFAEVTSPMSPLPSPPLRAPMHFPKLRYLQIRNATMNAPQLKGLISSHSQTVKEFDFENVVLINNGNWEDALAPLDRDDAWSRSSLTAASECSFATISSAEDLPSPSAAVAAASRELLDVDLGGFSFSDEDRELIEGLSDDIMAAREASMSVTTKLKKKRRRRRRHHREEDEGHPAPVSSPSSSHRRKPSKPQLKSSFEILRPSTPTPMPVVISAPILTADPQPILLQPTVYDPSKKLSFPSPTSSEGISNVQRNLRQEESHRLMAEDPAARTSALQKAKEAVLSKLGREFGGGGRRHKATAEAVAACRLMTSREFLGGGYCGSDVVLEDRRGLETGSVMVPLMFSRA